MASQWFIRQTGKVHGPFDSTRLKQLVVANRITPHSEVAQSPQGPWLPAGKIKGLFQSSMPSAQPQSAVTPSLPLEPEQPKSPSLPPPNPTPTVTSEPNRLPSRATNSLGIGSIILGTLGFVTCWIPLVGIIGMPLSLLGTLLGGVGIALAIIRKGGGIGLSIAGTAISAVAILVAAALFWFTHQVVQGIDEAAREIANADTDTNQVVVAENTTDAPKGSDANTPAGSPAADVGSAEFAGINQPVQQGSVQVTVLGITEDFVKLTGLGEAKHTSQGKHLLMTLDVRNISDTKKITYRGWSQNQMGLDSAAELMDNFDNRYMLVNFGLTTRAEGQVTVESLYPGKSVTDVLVFEPPIEKAEFVFLSLPASKFGGEGMLRFRIPLAPRDESQDTKPPSDLESSDRAVVPTPARTAPDAVKDSEGVGGGEGSSPRGPDKDDEKPSSRFPPLGDRYKTIPQQAKDAVSGLRELRAATDIGLNVGDYKTKIQDVLPPVKLFLDSHEAKELPELAFLLDNACDCYLEVREMWSKSIYADSTTEC